MKTKEEILAGHYPDFDIESGWMFDGAVSNVFNAMDEYAKQFGQWLREQRPDVFYGSPTTDQLLQVFESQSQNK